MLIERQIALQRMVFSESLNRRQLMEYSLTPQSKQIKVQVFRNHSFELIEHTIAPFMEYAGISASFDYGGYDDSFSFADLDTNADLVLIWVDAERYKKSDITVFLSERTKHLRSIFNGPILVVPTGCDFVPEDNTIISWSLSSISEQLGAGFFDLRAQSITGTRLSRAAMLQISRELGLRYFPALVKTPLKAIAVDLDNTLYKGVLGEDGITGLELTDGHKELQEKLKSLAASGLFLCAISKNEQSDVLDLFKSRCDFPLNIEDFTKISASWGEKSAALIDIAAFLNIGTDSILFIDDNIGELAAMYTAVPDVMLLLAYRDGKETCHMLDCYPGIFRLSSSREDSLRKADVQANEEREKLQHTLSPEEYIRSLHMRLQYVFNDPIQVKRISELSKKTNQFIFNYQRYSEIDVVQRIESRIYDVVTVSLSDCLSDSGLIGVLVGKKNDDTMLLEECFISCRALGRGIDDIIILGSIKKLMDNLDCTKLQVAFQKGARNIPAENFVKQYLQNYLSNGADFSYEFPEDLIELEFISH